ncbi:hypothetical protein H6G33_09650 [Calothrix sp. FACHB-1219]|uniref:hypothetical protein n=1 Tax=unclassified Calothrix TaxID=2619626 RepID=UPI0016861208|nr:MULTISPECIES: hypothetical protein [unclassified Calothrix]MBD2201611.1 hypothetical protein [Calothrix sp. FACHB-168]MBD2217297.1 hypothetical protein [Calothrix sp. FACHB-1219]
MKISVRFEIHPTYISKFVTERHSSQGVAVAAKNLETGEVGWLHVCHKWNLQRSAVEKAKWIITCGLPSKYNHLSPFGGNEKYLVDTKLEGCILTASIWKDEYPSCTPLEGYSWGEESSSNDSSPFPTVECPYEAFTPEWQAWWDGYYSVMETNEDWDEVDPNLDYEDDVNAWCYRVPSRNLRIILGS